MVDRPTFLDWRLMCTHRFAMDGKKVRLLLDENRRVEARFRITSERFSVIELNEAARQRAELKRILKFLRAHAANDLTVA